MLEAEGTLTPSIPSYERDAILRASPFVLSAFSMQVGTPAKYLVIEQPLRAETGMGTFRVENGWIENGKRLHSEHRVLFAPDTREMQMMLRHEAGVARGRVVLEVGGALNSGHVPCEHERNVGLAWCLAKVVRCAAFLFRQLHTRPPWRPRARSNGPRFFPDNVAFSFMQDGAICAPVDVAPRARVLCAIGIPGGQAHWPIRSDNGSFSHARPEHCEERNEGRWVSAHSERFRLDSSRHDSGWSSPD